jgi:hypothetical protein
VIEQLGTFELILYLDSGRAHLGCRRARGEFACDLLLYNLRVSIGDARTVLQSGLQVGTPATVALVREVISILASLGGTGYLDLITPTADAPT